MKLIRSFGHAGRGIKYCFKTQLNFRIHVVVLIAVVVAGLALKISSTEWLFIIGCSMLVLSLELINTAIEHLCDVVTTSFHPAIKIIKDTAAGAVLLSAAGSVVTGCVIFYPSSSNFLNHSHVKTIRLSKITYRVYCVHRGNARVQDAVFGRYPFSFSPMELILAWIPFRISLYLSKKPGSKWLSGGLLAAWLLFFPNALYIITDLVHLEEKSNVPIWYDAVLLFMAATTGLLMAFASLYKVEVYLTRQTSNSITNKLIVLCLFAGSFGVYLGRFLRWNSWDIVTNPIDLAKEIVVRFVFPIQYYQTWAITLLFTSLFCLLYFAVKKIAVSGAM